MARGSGASQRKKRRAGRSERTVSQASGTPKRLAHTVVSVARSVTCATTRGSARSRACSHTSAPIPPTPIQRRKAIGPRTKNAVGRVSAKPSGDPRPRSFTEGVS
jgi:hypothetical protein